MFFALLVITVSFLPIFTLEATEGRLFRRSPSPRPTRMAFAALLAITLDAGAGDVVRSAAASSPSASSRSRARSSAIYTPVLRFAVRRRRWIVIGAVLRGALDDSGVPVARHRVHAAARTRARCSTCRRRRPACPTPSRPTCCSAWGRCSSTVPEVETVFGKIGRARTVDRSRAARHGRDGDHAQARGANGGRA